ncbi:NAD(P)-binding protein [Auriscalpium vulgare]|uniref:NAD(P)-binding protein n=1 Tax=Auriscalpium vulgare TaxID=40419 RepID=A0ACB8S553_9AGAM|nr:NAD(P)-binding protein [Auriscalpium vulgare]
MADLSSSRVWLITGTGTGLGRALLDAVLASHERAVATLRRPEVLADISSTYPAAQLLVLPHDVTSAEQTAEVFRRAEAHFGRVDVVVNNAGHLLSGEVEATPDDMARFQMEVLFWGAVNVTKEAVRFFREVNPLGAGGRILQVSSQAGSSAKPGCGFYAASKAALELMTDALNQELRPEWNIRAIIVQPGAFDTPIWSAGFHAAPPHPAYGPGSPCDVLARALPDMPMIGDLGRAARAMMRIAGASDPPLRVQLGTDAWRDVRGAAERVVREGEVWKELSDGTNREGYEEGKLEGAGLWVRMKEGTKAS